MAVTQGLVTFLMNTEPGIGCHQAKSAMNGDATRPARRWNARPARGTKRVHQLLEADAGHHAVLQGEQGRGGRRFVDQGDQDRSRRRPSRCSWARPGSRGSPRRRGRCRRRSRRRRCRRSGRPDALSIRAGSIRASRLRAAWESSLGGASAPWFEEQLRVTPAPGPYRPHTLSLPSFERRKAPRNQPLGAPPGRYAEAR